MPVGQAGEAAAIAPSLAAPGLMPPTAPMPALAAPPPAPPPIAAPPPPSVGLPFTAGPPAAPAAPLPAPQQTPEPALPKKVPPAPIPGQGAKIRQPQVSEKITNPFERQASMILDAAQGQAKRLSDNLGEAPAGYQPASSETVHEMFHFSPYGVDAPREFWRQHDELLRLAVQHGDADPYAVAEQGALKAVYPYRAELGQLDSLGPEEKVARANELAKMTSREAAKGNPPDSLRTIVSPHGLPGSQNPAPDAPAFNPQFAPPPSPPSLPTSGNPATLSPEGQ